MPIESLGEGRRSFLKDIQYHAIRWDVLDITKYCASCFSVPKLRYTSVILKTFLRGKQYTHTHVTHKDAARCKQHARQTSAAGCSFTLYPLLFHSVRVMRLSLSLFHDRSLFLFPFWILTLILNLHTCCLFLQWVIKAVLLFSCYFALEICTHVH